MSGKSPTRRTAKDKHFHDLSPKTARRRYGLDLEDDLRRRRRQITVRLQYFGPPRRTAPADVNKEAAEL